jgi:uncharacterized protein
MRIDLGRLAEEGERLEGEIPSETLGLQDPDVAVLGPIVYRLVAVRVFDELLVDGSVKVRVRFLCGRCAEAYETDVEEPGFHFDCHVEKGGEFVDLTGEIRESILLAFPVYPLCRSGCRGLCPKCGANRNRKSCRCKPLRDDAQWGALNGLKLD